jgi:ATP-dependent Clp protease ATP-binding subunit ClpC
MAEKIEDENSKKDGNAQENTPIPPHRDDRKTPFLDNFGRDLTKLSELGKLEAVIGREEEIDRVIQVLSRKKKNNPVLVGEAGVGKTAIVEGLAKKINEKKVSRILHGKRVIELDLSLVVAGTKYRGQFEERMKAIMEELEQNPNIIVFLDEIHTIIGAGNSAGAMDAGNMLKPALARGTLQLIGATTVDEYKKSIEKDGALERRFQKVMVEPPSTDETKNILRQIKGIYEDHHNVEYIEKAIDVSVDLAERYVTNRFFPDKAIDIVDEVGARKHIDNIKTPKKIIELEKKLDDVKKEKEENVRKQKYEDAAKARDKERQIMRDLSVVQLEWEEAEKKSKIKVDENDVAKVVSRMIGVPVERITEDEGSKLVKMPSVLRKRLVGQNEAVEKVCEAIQRSRAGLQNPNKPIASFIFLGSTGIGKTELCKALAEYLFNDESALIKIDMSEYMEPHSVSKMIGSPPGYVGYDEGGQLTEKVRNKPYSVVLFDEIEKAHRSVANVFLQILDEGRLTDGLGRTINFRNTIIIMTSNVGTTELSQHSPVGFEFSSKSDEFDVRSIIEKAMKKRFSPEFINRIDEHIVFNKLSENDVSKIADIHISKLATVVKKQGYELEVTPELKEIIVKDGYSDEFGARPILRMITKYVQNPVSKQILLKSFNVGDTIKADWDKKKEEVIITSKK